MPKPGPSGLGSSVAGPRSCGGGRPGCPLGSRGFRSLRGQAHPLTGHAGSRGRGRPPEASAAGEPRPPSSAPPLPRHHRNKARPPAASAASRARPALAGSAHGGRRSTEDAEMVSDRSGPGSFPAAQRSGVGSFVGPSGPPGAALPTSRSSPQGDSRTIPGLIPPGPRGWKLRGTRFRGSFPPNRTKCGCACSAPARMNPDRAIVRPPKRSSSGAIG